MAIFNKTNNIQAENKKQLDTLTKDVGILSRDWATIAEINRNAYILAADTKANVTGGEIDGIYGTGDKYDGTTLEQINKNQIPPYMSWEYWIWIHQWKAYWVGRYSNFESEHKRKILAALGCAVLYGLSAVTKEGFIPLYITTTSGKQYSYEDEVIGYPVSYFMGSPDAAGVSDSGTLNISDEKIKIAKKDKNTKIYKTDELHIFTWRDNGIGDFVWVMKYGLLSIFFKAIMNCNLSQLTNKSIMKVRNKETFKTELAINSNPFIPVGVIIANDSVELSSGNSIIERNHTIGDSHIEQIIMGMKQNDEWYCQLFGRGITSSKNQSLSSDANLSMSSCELVAQEHDELILETFKAMNINLDIEELELNQDTEPENENADKEGDGQANTDGDSLEKKE